MNIEKGKWYLASVLTKWKYGKMGKHSYLGKTMFVQRPKKLFIGDNVRIYPGMRAEMTKETASITIEEDVSIGQNFHVVSYDRELVIGSHSTISGNVFISNVNHSYQELNVHALQQKLLVKDTIIGSYCFIGYGAVILPGTKLGKQCIVGANSVVSGEFPDYCVIAGAPAKIIRIYNKTTNLWERYEK